MRYVQLLSGAPRAAEALQEAARPSGDFEEVTGVHGAYLPMVDVSGVAAIWALYADIYSQGGRIWALFVRLERRFVSGM